MTNGSGAKGSSERRKRLAIYGGTFDPVHLAHLEIARKVVRLFQIDRLLFVPAWRAPHKTGREVTAPLHRYAMLALATQDDQRLAISSFELEAPDRRYTVDTLAHFRGKFTRTELFFVMGGDSWAEIATWHDWQRLITMADFIVVTRPGYDLGQESAGPESVSRIIDLRDGGSVNLPPYVQDQAPKIFFTDLLESDISASQVRSAAREERDSDLQKLVPQGVANYIRKYKLYRKANEA